MREVMCEEWPRRTLFPSLLAASPASLSKAMKCAPRDRLITAPWMPPQPSSQAAPPQHMKPTAIATKYSADRRPFRAHAGAESWPLRRFRDYTTYNIM